MEIEKILIEAKTNINQRPRIFTEAWK